MIRGVVPVWLAQLLGEDLRQEAREEGWLMPIAGGNEVLGEATLDLTADIEPLVRKMDEAEAIVNRDMSRMENRIHLFSTRMSQIGQNLQKQFLLPVSTGFDQSEMSAASLDGALRGLTSSSRDTKAALLDTGGAAMRMADQVRQAFLTTARNESMLTTIIVEGSRQQVSAINDVTQAYERLLAAQAIAGDAYALNTLANRPAAPQLLPPPAGAAQQQLLPVSSDPVIWGARGPRQVGSIHNPMVMTIEAGQYAGMGGYAAATSQLSKDVPATDPALVNALLGVARAQRALPAGPAPGSTRMPGHDAGPALHFDTAFLRDFRQAQYDLGQGAKYAADTALSAKRAAADARAQAFADALGAARDARTVSHLQSIIDRAPVAAAFGGGPGGTGGGGGGPPVALGGGGGGGGGGLLSALLWGGGSRWGGGRFMPAFAGAGVGSIGSFAGLDPLHAITTLGSVVGSAGAGLAGAGTLAAGAAGQMAVGGLSDAAVMKTTIANTNTLRNAMDNLDKTIAVYGPNSRQAAVAQAQLNFAMGDVGPAAKQEAALAKAQLALGDFWKAATGQAQKTATGILTQVVRVGHDFVPLVASAAQRNLSIIDAGLRGPTGFFAWLRGPQGMGIFQNLENNFARNLPTAVHAFSQALEVVMRYVSIASDYTGGFVKGLDRVATRLNQKPDSAFRQEIVKLVGDFHRWEQLLRNLGLVIFDLFRNDAQTGNTIVDTLNKMLVKLDTWEKSTAGRNAIHNIFEVHKQEVLALLQLLPPLLTGFGRFYLLVAPPLVRLFTEFAVGVGDVLQGINGIADALGSVSPVLKSAFVLPLGAFIAAWKLFSFKEAVGGIRSMAAAFGILTAAENVNAAAAGRSAAANVVASGAGAGGAATGLRALGRGGALGGVADAAVLGGAGLAASAAVPAAIGATMLAGAAGLDALYQAIGSPGQGQMLDKTVGTVKLLDANLKALQKQGVPTAHAIDLIKEAAKRGDQGLKDLLHTTQLNSRALGAQVGDLTAQRLKGIWHPTGAALFQDFYMALKGLGPAARENASLAMIQFAEGLVKNKQLPKGQLTAIVKSLETVFPGLRTFIETQGLGTADAIARTFQLKQARANWKTSIENFRTEWGLWSIDQKITTDNIGKNTNKAMDFLKAVIKGGTKDQRLAAEAELKLLRDNRKHVEDKMLSNTRESIRQSAAAYRGGFKSGLSDAAQQFVDFEGQVRTSVANHTFSAKQGARMINEAFQTLLRSFGAKNTLPVIAAVTVDQIKATFGHFPFNQGGLVQVGQEGAKGRDTIPMSVGGTNIVVGSGEKVAVFNNDQQAVMDRALAREGYAGLGGMFDRVNRPHYMARGGGVPGFKPIPYARVTGDGGTLQTVDERGFHLGVDAANAYLKSHQPAPVSSTGAGGGGAGSTTGLVPQVLAAIAYARAHGWTGSIISGFRSYASQAALYAAHLAGTHPGPVAVPGTSMHERGLAVDVTDIAGFARAMSSAPPNARLIEFLGSGDPSHFSTTGHARGGFVNYAKGGLWDPHRYGKRRHPLQPWAGAPPGWGAHPASSPTPIQKYIGTHIDDWVEHYEDHPRKGVWGALQRGMWDHRHKLPQGPHDKREPPALGMGPLGWIWGTNHRPYLGFAKGGFAKGGLAYHVMASAESTGGLGSFGFSPGPSGYSILGQRGDGSDGNSGAGYAFVTRKTPPYELYIRHGSHITKQSLQDQGSGSPGIHPYPTIGLYPTTRGILGTGDSAFVDIERVDGKPFETLRGTSIAPFGALAGHGSHGSSHTATPTRPVGPVKMYDTVGGSLGDIPAHPQAVASYVDNLGGYSEAKRKFPGIPIVSISVNPGNNKSADIYDVEPGGKSASETISAIASGRARGAYGGASSLGSIRSALSAKHIPRDHYKLWLAAWPGSGANVTSGYDAHQYAAHNPPGPNYDESMALASFFTHIGGAAGSRLAKRRIKTSPKGKKKTGPKIPTLPDFSAASFLEQINNADDNISRMNAWEGFISSLHGSSGTVLPVFTDNSDPNNPKDMLNWGTPGDPHVVGMAGYGAAPIGSLTGMQDPITGRNTKGVWDRLREIGLQTDRFKGNEQDSELGIEESLLEAYKGEIPLAKTAQGAYDGWLEKMQSVVLEIRYLQHRRDKLAPEKLIRKAAIREKFEDEMLKIRKARLTGTFDATSSKSSILTHLRDLETQAKGNLPSSPPPGLSGGVGQPTAGILAGWRNGRQREAALLTTEYRDMIAAVEQQFRAHAYHGAISRANAVHALSETEKKALLKIDVGNINTRHAINQKISDDKATGAQSTLHNELTTNKVGDKINSYLDPAGALAISIKQISDINIPNLLREVSDLTGTVIPKTSTGTSGTTTTDATLLALNQQLLQQRTLELAVSEAQFKVLNKLPPFPPYPPYGGHFAEGGVVPGLLGEPRTIIAHGGEKVTPPGEGDGPNVKVRVEDHRVRVWVDEVEQIVSQSQNKASRKARRNLPGRGGGLIGGA